MIRSNGSQLRLAGALLMVAVVGCHSGSSTVSDGGTGGSGGTGGGGGATGSTDMAVAGGPGTVTGTITPEGTPLMFGDVKTAWMIGHPDANSTGKIDTVAVYMFNAAVSCHDAALGFGAMGWDGKLPDKTQFLEIKAYGPTTGTSPPVMPGTFSVINPGPTTTPSPGQAVANHSLSHPTGTASAETITSTGTLMITSIVDKASAVGSFTLHFPNNETLMGTFNAGYCDIGVEP